MPSDEDERVLGGCLASALEHAAAVLEAAAGTSGTEALPGVDVAEVLHHLQEVLGVFATATGCPGGSFAEQSRCLLLRAFDAPAECWRPWRSRDRALWTLVGELLVHAWDVDNALHLHRPAPHGCAEAVAACRDLVDEYRRLGTVGPEKQPPADADDLERLVALYGRDVGRV